MERIVFASAYNQLKPSEREFVDGFVNDLAIKATRAFERIMVALAKFTERVDASTLDPRAQDMFAKPLVSAAIVERVNRLALESDLSPEWILRKQKTIAAANMADFTNRGEDGYLRPDFSRVTDEQMAAVKSFKFKEEYTRGGSRVQFEFALHDPQVALGQLSRHTGLEKQDNPVYANYAADITPQISANASTETLAEEYARLIAND